MSLTTPYSRNTNPNQKREFFKNTSRSVAQAIGNSSGGEFSEYISQSPILQKQADLSDAVNSTYKEPNLTGLPDDMKSNFESNSGFDLSDVRVNYNSDKPAQLQALAYAQGSEIHIAPGQEQHLGHELWHVVQQKQGRVTPTHKLEFGFLNADPNLEGEAERLGQFNDPYSTKEPLNFESLSKTESPIQARMPMDGPPETQGLYQAQQKWINIKLERTADRPRFGEKVTAAILSTQAGGSGGGPVMAQTSSGWQPVHPDAVQIDHNYAWKKIKDDLFAIAENLNQGQPLADWMNGLYKNVNGKWFPTEYAGRMYFNDMDNLRAMSAKANAAKGDAAADPIDFARPGEMEHAIKKEVAMMEIARLSQQYYEGMSATENPDDILHWTENFQDSVQSVLTRLKATYLVQSIDSLPQQAASGAAAGSSTPNVAPQGGGGP